MASYLTDAELDVLKAEYPEVSDDCPTCHNKGTYRWRDEDNPCDCSRQRHLFLRYLQAGIGPVSQRLDWDDYVYAVPEQVTDYLDKAQAYVEQGMGLFLSGPRGIGKTMLATLVLKELVKHDYTCYTTTFSSTVEAFTAGWSDVTDKHRFAVRFMQSRVLMLDDMGKEFRRSNRLEQTTFDHILRTRAQNARPTILTTNMTAEETHRGYGAAVLSLLVEKSIEVPLTGADFRPDVYNRVMAEVKDGEVRPIV